MKNLKLFPIINKSYRIVRKNCDAQEALGPVSFLLNVLFGIKTGWKQETLVFLFNLLQKRILNVKGGKISYCFYPERLNTSFYPELV